MHLPDDTIVAIATPLGEGGLGVVRLSGAQALTVASKIFRSKHALEKASTHTLHHGWIADHTDEAVLALFRAPTSYTGEDVVEISSHGSPLVLKEIVRRAVEAGARQAEPGEFTKRAYLNGKMDLSQAEAVVQLIHAQSSKARSAAADQLRGVLSARVNDVRQHLIDLLAHIEANLDFAEEDIPPVSKKSIADSLAKAEKELAALLATGVTGRVLRNGLRVALAGKPNVGKSSLFNALLAHERAIVTEHPGTTRDILEERLEWNGMPVVLMDTAGLRDTANAVELIGTDRAKEAHAQADVIVFVVDSGSPVGNDDRAILDRLKDKKIVVALNKSDLGNNAAVEGRPSVATSAKKGTGLTELAEAVVHAAGISAGAETQEAAVVTNERHVTHLENAQAMLKNARAALDQNKSEEALALDVRKALEELSAITGESAADDVLSAIFRQFCIGK